MNSFKPIDLTQVPVNEPSICIPRVFKDVNEDTVRSVFNKLNFGFIRKIEIINKFNQKGENFKCVFIHFKNWNVNQEINETREKLLSGKDIKIMYNEPWFWKVVAYRKSDTIFKIDTIFKNEQIEIRTPPCSPPRWRKEKMQLNNENNRNK
jgi:hypothetical protein